MQLAAIKFVSIVSNPTSIPINALHVWLIKISTDNFYRPQEMSPNKERIKVPR